jgi:hypothetical protein
MPDDELVDDYLRALGTSDVALITSLFAPGAIVHSPLYGPTPATEFYPALFADTESAVLTSRSTMRGTDREGRRTLGFRFHFDWRLSDGSAAPFDVVDIATLDDSGRIAELTIIYDTHFLRAAFESASGKRSWHPAG